MKGIFGWFADRFGDGLSRHGDGADEGASFDPARAGGTSGSSGASGTSEYASSSVPSEDVSVFDEAERTLDNEELRPISIERIGLLFDSQGWKWDLDDEGDIASGWDGHMFYFRLGGSKQEVLNVVAFRSRPLPEQVRSELLFVIEEWHRNHLWPTCYFRESEGDSLQVLTEHNVDFEHGVTDAQLVVQFQCAIGTSLQFFAELDERFGRGDEADGAY